MRKITKGIGPKTLEYKATVRVQYHGTATLELGKPSDIGEAEFNIIRSAYSKDWPRDFNMQAYCEKQQFEAVRGK